MPATLDLTDALALAAEIREKTYYATWAWQWRADNYDRNLATQRRYY